MSSLSVRTPFLGHSTLDTNHFSKDQDKAIENKAKEFESVFISESLKHAEIGMPKDPLIQNSLITDTFDGFMTRALADQIVEQGGFGLSEHIEAALKQ